MKRLKLKKDPDVAAGALLALCVASTNARVEQHELYVAYREFALASGVRFPRSTISFNRYVRELGYRVVRLHGAKLWCGLGLRNEPKGEDDGSK